MLPSRSTVNLDMLNQSYRISCRLNVGATGLIGLLNDVNTTLVDLEDAYYSRLQEPARIVAHLPNAHMSKTNIGLVVLTRREDLGPQGLTRGGYTRLLPVPVLSTTATFEIQGSVEVVTKFDASELLRGGTGRFINVYGANAIAASSPEAVFSGEVILVNRAHVELVAPMVRGKA